jgi:hypothetical protein
MRRKNKTMILKRPWLFALPALAILVAYSAAEAKLRTTNDFPTADRAEYVFACMGTNNMTPEYLEKCSCAIDVIASRISYEEYLGARTVLTIRQAQTPNADLYKSVRMEKEKLEGLFRAEAGAILKCF